MPITYSISSANNSLTEDYDRLNISVNGVSTNDNSTPTFTTSWPSYVIAVKGTALPRIWDNSQYQNSFVEPLGVAGSTSSFVSHELPYTPIQSGTNIADRILEVNSSLTTPGPEFLYNLNSISRYESTTTAGTGTTTVTQQQYIQITKVNADTGIVVSSFGTGGKLEIRSSSNDFGASQNSPEVVTDNTGNLYVLRDGEGSNSFQNIVLQAF